MTSKISRGPTPTASEALEALAELVGVAQDA
jgi:hypothetical protein